MQKLPIYEVIPKIINNFKYKNSLILEAPPGAGKSTVVPISFLAEPWLKNKMIIMLEPRRVAARMVASRMAQLLDENVGETIGYQVKMDSCKSSKTKILVVTEAILVRMLQNDQSLQNVSMVIFDEFHERSIHTDLSLALSLQVQELLRDDLKILIMSATLNSISISKLLGDVPIITSKGKVFNVEDIYLPLNIKQPDFKTINKILFNTILSSIQNDTGDILVFLCGVKEIKFLQKSLNDEFKNDDIIVLPLYSALTKREQDKAIYNNTKRKIILSTNIAQTSLTIDGIKVVVDSGLEKLSRYNYSNGMDHLELTFISKDSSIQRGGRAGRTSYGKCYKLWHKAKILTPSTKPEILRTDLSSLMLNLALWGVNEFEELKWMDIPQKNIINDTKEILQELNMLDNSFSITTFGKKALDIGLHPRYSYMILKASDMGYGYEACLLCSMLSEKDIFTSNYKSSDLKERFIHLYENNLDSKYINNYVAREIIKQAKFFYTKLQKIITQPKKCNFHNDILSILLLFAYPDRLARQRKKDDIRYKLSNSKGAKLSNEDTLFNEPFLVVASLNAQNKDSFINLAIPISLDNIEEYFSSFIKNKQTITFNKIKNKFDIKDTSYFIKLNIYSTTITDTSKINFKKLILDLIKIEGLKLLPWNKKTIALKDKINFINKQQSLEYNFPNFSEEYLINNLDIWLEPYLEEIKDIKDLANLDIYNILLSQINWEKQQQLDTLLPKSIKVPSGSNIYIDYSSLDTPVLSVKIQEIFGMMETPKILNNTIALQIHLLSPAYRPIQITYDLKSFWKNSYEEVRKELRGTYKRHYWPENPYEAIATNKTKRHMDKQ